MPVTLYHYCVRRGGRYVLYCVRQGWPKKRHWIAWDREQGAYITDPDARRPKRHTREEARALADVPLSPETQAWMDRASEAWDQGE